MIGASPEIAVGKVCARLAMTRQNYYKQRKERERRRLQGEVVSQHVLDIRRDHPRIGVRKLRTIVALENTLILSFFRSQGLMAGPLIALETDLEP